MSNLIDLQISREIAAQGREVATALAAQAVVLHLDTVPADKYTAQMAREDAIACGAVSTGIADAAYGKLEVSIDGPERKYYTLRTYGRMGAVAKMGSLGRTLIDAMRKLIERQSLCGFTVVVIEDDTRDLRNKCIGFGKYADRPLIDLMASDIEAERNYVFNTLVKAVTMRNGKPSLVWAKPSQSDIVKNIPKWLYDTLIEIKTEQEELARTYKAERTEAKASTSFHVGQIGVRIKTDTLTCTQVIAFVDPRCIYINGETHSYKARFTNKDGQIIEAYADNRNQYTVGETFTCAMTPKAHFITKEGDRVTRVNRITRSK